LKTVFNGKQETLDWEIEFAIQAGGL